MCGNSSVAIAGFLSIRHRKICDLAAFLLTEDVDRRMECNESYHNDTGDY